MISVNFKPTSSDSDAPVRCVPRHAADSVGWLLYPHFSESHIVIRPGETLTISCAVKLECEKGCMLSLYSCTARDQSPVEGSSLVVHSSVCSMGDDVAVRVTNASSRVHVIVKSGFDITPLLGHGIFRSAVIIPYDAPIAYGLPTACRPELPICSSDNHTSMEGRCSF